MFVSGIEIGSRRVRLLIDATRPSQVKEHSALKSLCHGTKNRSDLARYEPKFASGNVRSATRGNMVAKAGDSSGAQRKANICR
jgi:hypothetical protein